MNDNPRYDLVLHSMQINQMNIIQFGLGILKFNGSDSGYYWCQVVVNNVPLSPSPYGHLHGSHDQCTFLDAIGSTEQPICAQNTSVLNMTIGYGNPNNCLSLSTFDSVSTDKISTMIISQEITTSNVLTKTGNVTVLVSKYPTTEVIMSSFPTTKVVSSLVAAVYAHSNSCIEHHLHQEAQEAKQAD